MNTIDQFEHLAERLVEGTFSRIFADRLSPMKVAAHLERAIEEHQIRSSGGTAEAPTHYWIYLNPRDYEALRPDFQGEREADAQEALARQISELVSDADLALETPPIVHIRPDGEIPPREVRVDARWAPDRKKPVDETRSMEAAGDPDEEEEPVSEGPRGRPFIVLEGQRHVNLTQPTVSIGRALDNDVIIDDPRVSRHHAQLRHRYGHYVLYDLDSSGGTRINDYPVEECVLHSGDVISFAGVEVVYGEDPPTPIPLPEEHTPVLTKSKRGE
jgi:pSer/pThr/pTyr-binding forkhead associated (FHA) protein